MSDIVRGRTLAFIYFPIVSSTTNPQPDPYFNFNRPPTNNKTLNQPNQPTQPQCTRLELEPTDLKMTAVVKLVYIVGLSVLGLLVFV